jgi:hypothetical protein
VPPIPTGRSASTILGQEEPHERVRVAPRLFVLVLATLAVVSRAPIASAADEVLRDEWQILNINGARSGYSHGVVRRLADGTIETTTMTRMVMKRLGATVESASDEVTVERADGRSSRSSRRRSSRRSGR